ncbi:MAG: DUF2752 domain-containing protein [Flavobacteriaceae bacterium]|jgi:hypothetical protein|nr:DUF2752 domain-containing protein [Flavobacteriaceae bacterium]
MRNWFVRIVILLLFIIGLSYYYFLFGEKGQGGVTCIFNKTVGWQCPGCGGQRALTALLHGDFKQAFIMNPFIYVFLPLMAYLGIIIVEGYIIGNKKVVNTFYFPIYFGYWFLAIILIFTVLRNIFSF